MKRAVIAIIIVSAAVLVAWWVRSSTARAQSVDISQWRAQAKAEARKWQTDAQLVEIELPSFGFATDASGIPDMTKAGPPAFILFSFYSPSAREGVRIDVSPQPIPEQMKQMMQKMR